ncbi:MAG: capsule assembly Wzi family protein [Syntrophotaleaceae bacterium]
MSDTLPLDSWVYPALDKLAGLGLIDSVLQGARPYSRIEAARQVREALAKSESADPPPAVHELLDRLERFFGDELGEGAAPGSYLKPRELQFTYLYQDGDESVYAGTDRVDARQYALNYNNDGIDYGEHHNGQLIFQAEAKLGEHVLLSARPLLEILEDGDSTSFSLLHGKAALGLGPFEVSVGRQSLWWGQGRHGSLVLTNNAKPLDMVRITNPTPVLIPWIFKYLGPFRFDVFWSELEEDRVVPEPYFAGLRLNVKPLPWFEVGASRTVIFGGDGRPDVGWDDFLTILGGKNLEGDEDNSNNIAALDARLRLPFLWGAEIYGEYGGEDEAGSFLANRAWLAGLYLPRIEPSGRASMRLEYADLSEIDTNSPPWYRHGIYRSGYTYEGKIMGHHAGGGAKDIYGEVQLILPQDLLMTMGIDYESRGYDQPVREKHYQGLLKLNWEFREHLALNLGLGYGRIENADYEDGNDETHFSGSFGLMGTW